MNKNQNWIIVILLFIAFQLQAQEWSRKLSGPHLPQLWGAGSSFNGQDVQQTSDGNFVMTGIQSYATGAPRDYPTLVKVNTHGFTLWEKSYFSDNADVALFSQVSLVEMPNGNLLLAGLEQHNIHLIQTNSQGDTLWTKSYDSPCVQLGGFCSTNYLKLRATFDGNYILCLGLRSNGGAFPTTDETQLIKITPNGTVLWQKVHYNIMAKDLQATMDGGYVFSGWKDSIAQPFATIYKVDMNGDSLWRHEYPGIGAQGWMSMFNSVTQTADSGYVVVAKIQGGPLGADFFPIVVQLDKNGQNILWSTQLGGYFGDGEAFFVDYNPDGFLIVTGVRNITSGPTTLIGGPFVAKLDTNGTILEEKEFGSGIMSSPNSTNTVRPTANNGYIMVGSSFGLADLVKVDSSFRRSTHHFYGCIYRDDNLNCIKDSSEAILSGWIVEITKNTTGDVSYATTNNLGFYSIELDTGSYTIKGQPINNLWGMCVDSFTINSASFNDADTFNFGAQALVSCPALNVDISTPLLRRCFSNTYTISYCNNGTINEQNAYVEVALDTSLYLTSSSVPYTSTLGGNTIIYTFNIGVVPTGSCGSFTLEAIVSCFSQLGETHCAEAHIFPDTNCLAAHPLWDQSDIEIDATCYGDSIVYIIKNVGVGNMATQRQYFVTEDHVMLFVRPFQLPAGDSTAEVVYTTGGTYRMQAEQDPYHPYSTYSAAGVQMCVGFGVSPNGLFGVLIQYEEDDNNPAISIDCQQNRGSYDPNDKRASPVGYGANHYIEQNTDLEYHIRFQNTGTDTAFNVIIMDTLSSYLNPLSIVPGASSHPYSWELTGSGVLVFSFDNIMLPDSNVNEATSHGFVKFRIKQDVSNPIGTIINNTAGIVFDMNVPVLTNTTFHEIEEGFVSVELIGNRPNTHITIYPNPFQLEATIKIEGEQFNELEVHIFDVMGREVQYQYNQFEQQISIHRNRMNTGVYLFQLKGDGKLIGTGKIIVQ